MSSRARRIASDEARAWARNLRLGDVHAKLERDGVRLNRFGIPKSACF